MTIFEILKYLKNFLGDNKNVTFFLSSGTAFQLGVTKCQFIFLFKLVAFWCACGIDNRANEKEPHFYGFSVDCDSPDTRRTDPSKS